LLTKHREYAIRSQGIRPFSWFIKSVM
jgi:hypothetical protein